MTAIDERLYLALAVPAAPPAIFTHFWVVLENRTALDETSRRRSR